MLPQLSSNPLRRYVKYEAQIFPKLQHCAISATLLWSNRLGTPTCVTSDEMSSQRLQEIHLRCLALAVEDPVLLRFLSF